NPLGFPRLLNDDEPMEFIMTKDKILQVFQSEHRIRYLWTDGRELPSGQNLENLGPAWYGHSVGKWDGNTLIVNTVGLDERAWLDNLGYPKSFHARIEETWRHLDSNTLESQMTLFDPEYYTAPYVGAKRTFKRLPDRAVTYFGWSVRPFTGHQSGDEENRMDRAPARSATHRSIGNRGRSRFRRSTRSVVHSI